MSWSSEPTKSSLNRPCCDVPADRLAKSILLERRRPALPSCRPTARWS
jgi:hypothetical protein